ncbi:MAG TPA: HAMP domain-containing histidine kinase [Chloroflexi bacterium]|nr:HAMP domain-containing histidine kinase [Chloroflexota bacterium]
MNVTPAAGRRGFVGRRSAGATVLETALVCGVLLGLLALVGPLLSPPMLQRGYLNAVPIAVFWGALRLAVPEGSWRRRLVREVVVGAVVPGTGWGLMMALARYVATYGEPPSLASADVYLAVYAVSVLIYGAVRVAVRLWLFWDRLRRRHMVWSLTHALLATALVAVSPVVVVGVAGYALSLAEGTPSSIGGLASLLASMVIWGAPLAGAVLVVGVMGLLGLAPVLAVPAYVVARRTTRRLEALARVARDLRGGNLSARVDVRGEDEVAQLQRDVNAMATDLQRTMDELAAERDRVAGLLEARRELVAGVSHELRTPVATLRAHLESALRDDALGRERVSCDELALMHGEVLRLQALIEDLFALSRAEVGRLLLRRESVDLLALVRGVVGAMTPVAWGQYRVRLLVEGDGEPVAMADTMRVQQVVVNLVHNALRHTPPGGMVMVRASAGADRAVLEVCDTGEGIPPEDLPHVWDRYYRGAMASSDDGGSGLGLALVKQLTEAMGGHVQADSTPGQGSCFRVFLPMT